MKKKEKMVILVLAIITIALIVVGVVTKNNKNTKTANSKTKDSSQNAGGEIQRLDEENVVKLESGIRYNTSKKLNSEKEFDGMKISEIQLTEKANDTILLGKLTNVSGEDMSDGWINIVLLDEEGNEMTKMQTYVMGLKAGESTDLQTSTSLNYANAYDLKIVR